MNPKAIALALRAAADNLERAKQLVQTLPASAVDDDSALALAFDAPKVIQALFNVAGTIDPDGSADSTDDDDVCDLAELAVQVAAWRRAQG